MPQGLGELPRRSDRNPSRQGRQIAKARPLTANQATALAMYDGGASHTAIGRALGWKTGRGVGNVIDRALSKVGRSE